MLLVGVVLLAVGYSGGLGSPIAHQVQAFLDADGTPLRNVHKLEPLIRLPLALGLAHLLGRIPLPGSAPRPVWRDAFAHPERDKRVAVGIVVLVALTAATSLAWTGRLTPPGAFNAIPQYWHDDRGLARRQQHRDARRRTGAGGAGRPVRHPGVGQQPRRAAAGARRQPVGGARLDPADAAGDDPRPGLGAAAVRRGPTVRRTRRYPCPARHFVCGGAQRPGPGHVALGAAAPGAPRDRRLAGPDEGRAVRRSRRPGHAGRASSPTAGCGRATRRSRSTGSTAPRQRVAHRTVADADAMARVDGGPESLLRLDERRRLLGQPPLGPMLLTADAQRAGLPAPRRHGHRHPDGAGDRLRPRRRPLVGDPRPRRRPQHVQPGAGLPRRRRGSGLRAVARRPALGVELGVGLHGAAQRRRPPSGPRAAIDGDSSTSWVSNCAADRGRPVAAGRLRPPDHQRDAHHHARAPPPSARRCAGSRCRPPTAPARCGSTRRASR